MASALGSSQASTVASIVPSTALEQLHGDQSLILAGLRPLARIGLCVVAILFVVCLKRRNCRHAGFLVESACSSNLPQSRTTLTSVSDPSIHNVKMQ